MAVEKDWGSKRVDQLLTKKPIIMRVHFHKPTLKARVNIYCRAGGSPEDGLLRRLEHLGWKYRGEIEGLSEKATGQYFTHDRDTKELRKKTRQLAYKYLWFIPDEPSREVTAAAPSIVEAPQPQESPQAFQWGAARTYLKERGHSRGITARVQGPYRPYPKSFRRGHFALSEGALVIYCWCHFTYTAKNPKPLAPKEIETHCPNCERDIVCVGSEEFELALN